MRLLDFLLDFVKDQVHPQPAAPTRRLIIAPEDNFPADTDRIIRVCAAAGFEIDRHTAVLAWSIYCERCYVANWMAVQHLSDEYLLDAICQTTAVREEVP